MILLVVAVLAVSSAALLVRWADADPLALSFWRTAGGAVVLGLPALRSPLRPRGRQWWWLIGAGVALGVHFATWLASLEMTSVTASVTLVSSAPLLIAGWLWVSGRPPPGRTWAAVGLASAGVAVIVIGDALQPVGAASAGAPAPAWWAGRALMGDALALAGAAALAVYLVIGGRLRSSLPTTVYSGWTYGFAAVGLAPAALIAGIPLLGFDPGTWLAIGAIILGPQLLGHTVLNALLHRLGPVAVALALLVEPFGATVLVWLALGEVPPVSAVVGAPLVVAGLALQLRPGSLK